MQHKLPVQDNQTCRAQPFSLLVPHPRSPAAHTHAVTHAPPPPNPPTHPRTPAPSLSHSPTHLLTHTHTHAPTHASPSQTHAPLTVLLPQYMAMNREVNKRIAMEGGQNDSTAIDSISNVSSNNSSGGNGSDPNNARVSREHHIFFSAETNCWPTYLEAKGVRRSMT